MKPRSALLAAVCVVALGLSACGGGSAKVAEPPKAEGGSSPKVAESAAYQPTEVTACEQKMTIAKPPERVVIMNSTGLSAMAELGVLDRVAARFGVVDTSIFDKESAAKIEEMKVLESASSGSGHFDLSMETLLSVKPDLVVSGKSSLDVDKLRQAGVPLYVPAAYCDTGADKATFDGVYKEVETMAAIFGKQDKAKEINASLKERLAKVKPTATGTAVAVFVTPGDTRFYAYGMSSMVTPELEAVGLKNIFADHSQRVFEVSMESLLEKNPDYIVVLYQKDEKGAIDTFKSAHGALDLKAAKSNKIISLLFPLVDPPSPLSVDGVEKLGEVLAAAK